LRSTGLAFVLYRWHRSPKVGRAAGYARCGFNAARRIWRRRPNLVSRATPFSFSPGIDLRTCSAEDLLVLKLFASRPLDIRDAEGVVIRHKDELDWFYIEAQLRPLVEVKDEPAILDTLARLRLL
jgi:hypothetical protein